MNAFEECVSDVGVVEVEVVERVGDEGGTEPEGVLDEGRGFDVRKRRAL